MNGDLLDGLSGPALVAAASMLRTTPASKDMRRSVKHTGRTLVPTSNGEFVTGWDETTDGVWFADGMEQVRWQRPPAPRLSRAMAAVVRSCWPDKDEPLYPGQATTKDTVLAAYAALGPIAGSDDASVMGSRHAVGALTTLEAAGLIEMNRTDDTIRLGPAVATWPSRDEATLRAHWDRLPAAPEGSA